MTLLLVGGLGQLASSYRQIVESLGHELVYCEQKLPASGLPRFGAVMIIVPVCSHPLRKAAAVLAESQGVPVHYLRAPSISTVRRAMTQLQEDPHVHP